jgi:MFS family permease
MVWSLPPLPNVQRLNPTTSATLQPLSGKLYTHFGNKVRGTTLPQECYQSNPIQYTYLGFIILFELGSLICGVAPSSTVFIVGRAVAGLGTAGIFNGGLTIISTVVPLEKSPSIRSNSPVYLINPTETVQCTPVLSLE